MLGTDKRKEVSLFHYETDSSFYAEAAIPEPKYEEPKSVRYTCKHCYLHKLYIIAKTSTPT